MARSQRSRFETHLPLFQASRVACFHWGLVRGRTQTVFKWTDRAGGDLPKEWFHDLLNPDGSPHDPVEAEFIRGLLGEQDGARTP